MYCTKQSCTLARCLIEVERTASDVTPHDITYNAHLDSSRQCIVHVLVASVPWQLLI